MTPTCFIFGHRMPVGSPALTDAMRAPAFNCTKCGQRIRWDAMPKQVQSMRAEYLHRISTPNI